MRLVEFINAAKSARLSPADTLLLGSACPDILSTVAFSVSEGELSPSMDEIRKQLGRSISSGSVLATRLSSDPLGVGFPYRVSVDATPESLIVEAGTNCSFDEVLATLAELTQHKVDPFNQSGRVHVFRNVSGAPGGSPLSTIVTLQLNHSFADGRGAARILRGILSAATGPVEAASLGSAPTVVHSGIEILGTIGALARTVWRTARASSHESLPSSADPNATSEGIRDDGPTTISTVRIPSGALKNSSFTVTESALIAASASLPVEAGRTYQCELPIAAPPGVREGSANALDNVLIDIPALSGDSLSAYGIEIRDRMRAAIAHARSATGTAHFKLLDGAPAFLVRGVSKKAATARNTIAHDTIDRFKVTSYSVGPKDLTLCGSPAVFASSIPTLRPNDRLTVNFIGLGDTVTATVATRPGPIVDSQAFVEQLVAAVAELNPVDAQHAIREA